MKTNKNFNSILALALTSLCLLLFVSVNAQNPDWEVPANFKNMENPTDKADTDTGKDLWMKNCASCHGKEGLGDGPKADALGVYPGDFTSEEFQSQSDGAIYYKTTEGFDQMPSFKKSISDDKNRWLLVNFMRTLK